MQKTRRRARYLKRMCISEHRLPQDKRENAAFMKLTEDSYRGSMLDMLKNQVLYMDTWSHENKHLPDDKKELAKLLNDNHKVVDIVLATLFPWFGTNVGHADMTKFLKEIEHMERV